MVLAGDRLIRNKFEIWTFAFKKIKYDSERDLVCKNSNFNANKINLFRRSQAGVLIETNLNLKKFGS